MSYTGQFNGRSVTRFREMRAVCDWLTANHVLPADVPLDARITLDRRNMTIDVLLRRRGPKGSSHYVDPVTGDIARGTITVPIQRRPPVLASLGPARRKREPQAPTAWAEEVARWFGVPPALLARGRPAP